MSEQKKETALAKPEEAMEIPAHLRAAMDANAQASTDADSLASSSTSIPRISLKGKKFRFIEGGEEISKSDSIDIVILAVEPEPGKFIKTYYAGAYNPNDNSPPDCSSSNGVIPDSWVSNPQANRCSGCEKNQFGSATSMAGKKAKACRDAKRVWVTQPDAIDKTVFGLNIPVTSLRGLSEYGMFIKKNNFPLAGVITRLTMDDDAEFPQILFKHVGFLDESQFGQALERNQARDWFISMPTGPLLEDRSTGPAATPKIGDIAANVMASAPAETEGTPAASQTAGKDVASNW